MHQLAKRFLMPRLTSNTKYKNSAKSVTLVYSAEVDDTNLRVLGLVTAGRQQWSDVTHRNMHCMP